MSRGASRIYLKLFGVGIIEWRILSVLSIEGDVSANVVCEQIDLDKAAASRSVKVLEKLDYIRTTLDAKDTRKRVLQLTASGRSLHDRVLEVALKREERLLAGFSAEEIQLLVAMLRRLSANAEMVDAFDYEGFVRLAEKSETEG